MHQTALSRFGAGVLCLLALTAPAQELIVNGGFENTGGTFVPNVDNLMSLAPGTSAIPGWTTLNAELIWARNDNVYAQSPSGSFFLDLTGYHDSAPYGGVAQTIATTPGRGYRLSLNLGTYESTPVYAGPVSVAVVVDGFTNTTVTFTPAGVSNQWATFTAHFAAASNTTALAIVGTYTFGGAYIGLDEVSVMPLGPQLNLVAAGPGQAQIAWTPDTGTNWVLQQTATLTPGTWTNSPSGSTNPVVVPAAGATWFYRLQKP